MQGEALLKSENHENLILSGLVFTFRCYRLQCPSWQAREEGGVTPALSGGAGESNEMRSGVKPPQSARWTALEHDVPQAQHRSPISVHNPTSSRMNCARGKCAR